MPEPTTSAKALIIPNTGDLAGTWGSDAVNPNMVQIDAMLGGVQTLALTSGSVTLSATQAQNSLIVFTGTLSDNCQVVFPQPGYYIVANTCTVGSFYVQLQSSGGGNNIGAIPGKKCHVFNDGTDMDYVNMPDPGTAYDLHGATVLPAWMNACSIQPYLIKDGTIYNNSLYPALAVLLGNTFGGTPSVSFAVPDERARARIGLDTGSTNRLTTAISGVNGATMGSHGGNQSLTAHTHANVLNDPGHSHAMINGGNPLTTGGGNVANSTGANNYQQTSIKVNTTGITITNVSTGAGASQNVPPSIISFLPLIKTAILIGVTAVVLHMFPSFSPTYQINGAVTAAEATSNLSF